MHPPSFVILCVYESIIGSHFEAGWVRQRGMKSVVDRPEPIGLAGRFRLVHAFLRPRYLHCAPCHRGAAGEVLQVSTELKMQNRIMERFNKAGEYYCAPGLFTWLGCCMNIRLGNAFSAWCIWRQRLFIVRNFELNTELANANLSV